MNRGVMVTRGDPDTKELVVSAQGICHNEKSDEVNRRLSSYFEPLAEAYSYICAYQKRQFFGLRDFYRYRYTCTFVHVLIHLYMYTYVLNSDFYIVYMLSPLNM